MLSFTINQDRATTTIATPEITLTFSRDNGGLRLLRRTGGPNILGYGVDRPVIDVRLTNRGWLAERTFVRYLNYTTEERDGGVELAIVTGIGPFKVYDRYRITGTLIARRASIENVGEDEVQLNGMRLTLPWVRVGNIDTCRFETPGSSVHPHLPLSVAAAQHTNMLPQQFFISGQHNNPALERTPTQATGLLAFHDAAIDEALLCWYFSTLESAQPSIDGNGQAVTLTHEIAAAGWLASEATLELGTQYILLLHEPWTAALAALQRTWPICGLHVFDRPAAWARDAAIFETHAAEYGGLRGLTAALPALRALGINTLCLLPIWEFANHTKRLWDGNWNDTGNPYAILDFEAVDPTLGSSDDLHALIATAHEHELRVLVDLPMQGCAANARQVSEHPDWVCYDERGRFIHITQQNGLIAFDWTNQELQEYFLHWALKQISTYDLDGYRIVAPRTETPNWSRQAQQRASASSLGLLPLLERLQREIKWLKADAALLGDRSAPAYINYQDFAIDELPHHMFIHLAINHITPAELGEWLTDYIQALPPGMIRACFIESYQTRLINPLADGLRGSCISRMLLAGIVLCGFVPLIRFGQQHSEHASLQRLLHARTTTPALRYGTVQFNTIPCSNPNVFTVLREYDQQHLVGMLNVSAHKQTIIISLPVDQFGWPDGDYELHNLFGESPWIDHQRRTWRRDELLALRLTLDPFTAYCLDFQPASPTTPLTQSNKVPAPVDERGTIKQHQVALGEATPQLINGQRKHSQS